MILGGRRPSPGTTSRVWKNLIPELSLQRHSESMMRAPFESSVERGEPLPQHTRLGTHGDVVSESALRAAENTKTESPKDCRE